MFWDIAISMSVRFPPNQTIDCCVVSLGYWGYKDGFPQWFNVLITVFSRSIWATGEAIV